MSPVWPPPHDAWPGSQRRVSYSSAAGQQAGGAGSAGRTSTIYPHAVNGDVWVGAIATLVGGALGGAISFALSRQQLNDARLQRKEAEASEQRRRSEDRRFQAYSAFLTQARSYRHAVQAYYL